MTEPALAGALHNLGKLLARLGRHAQARAAAEEAVNLRHRWVTRGDSVDLRAQYAVTLAELGLRLSGQGQHAGALARTGEAVTMFGQLSEAECGRQGLRIASALTAFARARVSANTDLTAALDAAERSVRTCLRMADRHPWTTGRELREARAIRAAAIIALDRARSRGDPPAASP